MPNRPLMSLPQSSGFLQSQGWATTRLADLQDAAQPTYQLCLLPLNCFQVFHVCCCTTIHFCKLFLLVSLITLLFFLSQSNSTSSGLIIVSVIPLVTWRGPFTWRRTVNHPRTVDYVVMVRVRIYTHRSEVIQLICHPHTPRHKPPPACGSLCPSWPVWACVLQDGTLAEVGQTQWVQAPTSRSRRAS